MEQIENDIPKNELPEMKKLSELEIAEEMLKKKLFSKETNNNISKNKKQNENNSNVLIN